MGWERRGLKLRAHKWRYIVEDEEGGAGCGEEVWIGLMGF